MKINIRFEYDNTLDIVQLFYKNLIKSGNQSRGVTIPAH